MTLPDKVRKVVKESVYKKADDFCYMHKSRVESGVFMENLVRDPEVGLVLAEYMNRGALKTYIKDAILNRYMKDKKRTWLPSKPDQIIPLMRKIYEQDASIIYHHGGDIFLFRLDNGDLVLIAQGTLLKWETALRKALEFLAKSPGLPPTTGRLHTLLNIAILGLPFTEADRTHLVTALGYVGVKLHIADQG